MAKPLPIYSTLFQCLYDQDEPVVRHFGHYSIFRAVDSRDVSQTPMSLPRVHDFAVIWDEDHDKRIILVIEELLMAGLLPGIQFLGEHKGELTVILAAKTYFEIDVEKFRSRVANLTRINGDVWNVRVGMFDNSIGSLRSAHQCEFEEILGLHDEKTHAYLLSIDSMWLLGTKTWQSADIPSPPLPPGKFFANDRYHISVSSRKSGDPFQ